MGKNGILKNKAGEQIFPATTADQVAWNDRMNLKQAISEKLGAPYAASTVSSMTDRTRIYVYTGDESGYTKGNWYYWNGSSWVSGGVYNSVAVETDKTLTVAGKAADGEVVGQEIGSLKESFDKINSDYTFNLTWINDEYVDLDGTIKTYVGWRRTNYIKLPDTTEIVVTGTTAVLKYNAFYDADKKFISNFVVQNDVVISVPKKACYMILSGGKQQTSSYIVKGRIKGIDSIRNVLFPLTKIKICSFNVGMWYDGVSKGVPTNEVTAKSLSLRRFLSNENADFLLCEEARKYFDVNNTIDAYEKNIKYNYPNYFRTDDTTLFYGTREMLIASNKYINNATIHNYKCESERQYITFNSTINNVTITFILCHLSIEGNSTGIRQQEMEELAEFLEKCEYGVLCGDFNAFSITEFDTHFSAFNMANHGYFGDFNTWPVPGWESWNHCIDNIITTKSIKITNVLMGEITMSDHKPLIAELEF